MTKFLVETKGNIQVVGTGDEMHAHYNRPSVVQDTTFMQNHIGSGNVKILARLADEATDEAYEKAWLAASKDKEAGDALDSAREDVKDTFLKKFEANDDKPKKTGETPLAPK